MKGSVHARSFPPFFGANVRSVPALWQPRQVSRPTESSLDVCEVTKVKRQTFASCEREIIFLPLKITRRSSVLTCRDISSLKGKTYGLEVYHLHLVYILGWFATKECVEIKLMSAVRQAKYSK